jgi:hypothetical protein
MRPFGTPSVNEAGDTLVDVDYRLAALTSKPYAL